MSIVLHVHRFVAGKELLKALDNPILVFIIDRHRDIYLWLRDRVVRPQFLINQPTLVKVVGHRQVFGFGEVHRKIEHGIPKLA